MRQRKCLRGRFMMIRSSPTSFRTRRSAGWCRCRSLPSPSGTVFVRARCVWSTHEYLKGLAVSLPPRHSDAHFLEDAGFHRLPSILGAEAHGRFTSFLDYLAPLRSRAVPGPHWYVMILGVDPRNQREGVGRSLLQEMFRRADAEGAPCYLETAQPRNVPFYTNSGFAVVDHGVEPSSALPYWTFLRNPRTSTTQ